MCFARMRPVQAGERERARGHQRYQARRIWRCRPAAGSCAPGQGSAELYTLYAGWAFRFKDLPDGRRQILNFLLPGDLLGLQAAMFDAAQHGIEALTDVELCLLPRHKIWNLFGQMPELAFDVTWLGAREESHVDENLLSAGRRSAAGRIAALIVHLYKRADALALVAGNTFAFPLNQQHIADALGLSLVHTNKTLARLRRMGMFTLANGSLTLTDPRRSGERGATFRAGAGAAAIDARSRHRVGIGSLPEIHSVKKCPSSWPTSTSTRARLTFPSANAMTAQGLSFAGYASA